MGRAAPSAPAQLSIGASPAADSVRPAGARSVQSMLVLPRRRW